jgi:hypothetical protein
MTVNRKNYEIFFLDFYEKNLDPGQVRELMEFLAQNPDLKKEFDEFEIIRLNNNTDNFFPLKSSIKKKSAFNPAIINYDNYTQFLISSIEDELNESDARQLSLFIKENPSAARELELFKLTKIKPDLSIVYPKKYQLKHIIFKESVLSPLSSFLRIKNLKYAMAVAASFAILIGLFFLLSKTHNNSNNIIAYNKSDTPDQETTNLKQQTTNNKQQTKIKKQKTTNNKQETNEFPPPLLTPRYATEVAASFILDENPDIINPVVEYEYAALMPVNHNNHQDTNEIKQETRNKKQETNFSDAVMAKAMNVIGIESLPTYNPQIKRHKINNFWDVAFIFTKVYNRAFDKDVSMKEKFDNNGNLVAVNFQSNILGFEKNIK